MLLDAYMEAVACKELMHDNAAQEQKDAEVKRLYNKALNSKDITPGNRLYMQKYVEVARNKINGKGIMADTMKEMEMAAPKEAGKSKKGSKARTGGYHYERTAKAQLGKDFQDQFLAAPTFVFRLVDPIPSVDIPKGKFTPIYGIQAAGIIKQILDRPEEYYVSLRNEFVTHQPECAEDYIAIYKEECRNPPIFPKPAPQYPEAEKIILDPLSYTSHPFLPASTLARVLVNGV